METITYGLIGEEDINIGDGEFDVTLADGRVVTLTKVSSDSFPIKPSTLATLPAATQFGLLRYLTDTKTMVMDDGDEWVALPPGRGVFYPDIVDGADFDSVINALIADMPSEGGTIDARGFQGALSCNATITIDKPIRLLLGHCTITSTASVMIDVTTSGAAAIDGSSRGATFIRTTTASQTAIRANTTAPLRVSSLTIDHSGSTKTNGAGIHLTSPSGQNEKSRLYDLDIIEQFIGIQADSAARLKVQNCQIKDYRSAGVKVQNLAAVDYGDNVIDSCVIEHSTASAALFGIWHFSGSGLRVANCRIIGGQYGYALDIAGTSGVAILSGNYMTGQSGACVFAVRSSGSATFTGLIVTGNVLVGGAGSGVICNSTALSHVIITNNAIYALSPGRCIYIADANYCHIDVNTLVGNGGSTIGILVDSGADFVHIGAFTLDNITTPISNASGSTHIEPYIVHDTVSIDPGSIDGQSRGSATFTLTGANTGDRIHMEPPAGLHDDLIFVGARITSANTVTIYLYNNTVSPIDDGANSWNYTHFKKWV